MFTPGWEYRGVKIPYHTGTFVYPFNCRARNRHWHLWYRQCVSSWWPLDWFGYFTNCILIYDLLFKSLTDGVYHLFYLYWLMGIEMANGGLPFPGTGCPVPDVTNIYLMKCLMYGILFLQYSLSYKVVSAHTLPFWTSFHGPLLYHIYILYSGWSAGVLWAKQMILTMSGPWMNHLPSCVMVQC